MNAPPRADEVFTLRELEDLAAAHMSREVWDFVAGGAGEERTLAANLAAFDAVRLRPRVLRDVSSLSSGIELFGRSWAAPIAVAPMGFQTLAHADGEVATVQGAGDAGLPVVVSTLAGKPFAELAAHATSPLWLQLYCFRDRAVTRKLVEQATEIFEAIVLTVDAPFLGKRLRDLRNGFRLPPHIVPANLPDARVDSPAQHSRAEFDTALDWDALAWLRTLTDLPILVKGILSGADAVTALEYGVDGLIVSNHGGRQLDGAPAALDALAEVSAAVGGRCSVLMDGGVRRGADVLAALATGAQAVLVGRPVFYALATDQRAGVRRVLDILVEELTETMALTGATSIAEIGPHLLATPAAARDEPPRRNTVVATTQPGGVLRKSDLHGSLSDPLLDTMNFLNEVAERHPDAISFASGRPLPGSFDIETVLTHIRRYLEHLDAKGASPAQLRDVLYQYGPTAGHIRDVIADWLRKDEGIDIAPESVVVTVGCQEAMIITLRALFASPRDVLLVADPCYVGIAGAARLLDIPITAVSEGERGLTASDVAAAVAAERARGRNPRALYLVPDHANPSGGTLPLEERAALLEVAERSGILILEDSPYRLVSGAARVPSLKAMDHGRRVVLLGSFAKTAFPGARIGFAVADQEVRDESGRTGLLADELAKVKSMITVNTPTLSQAAIAGMLLACDFGLADANTESAAHYDATLRAVVDELARQAAGGPLTGLDVSWNRPSGGFFLTLDVPFRADDAALDRSAREFGVIWTPMAYFHHGGGGTHCMRLSTSYLTPARAAEGVARLARFIASEAGRARS
ncbi:MAG TPA: aminotransferase class I/II-fold pyridoxal phosphate-dependent enzyme [Actinocrinis sp.]|jgi:(S)-3,5-dihydroxyphenylglycine transaminase|uniref:aminotransferase class I/II-fold pyridoxal phosphate-dependent enzyme n=1 Tax=Actinocrinis sp. TaxID=1920516 RepID=UPI002DDCA78C|nr:aminotransferase class I/II-fold pyridoxal phosphate-dependent enzyme [Actinocrinis sp.]HEV3173701.1 aminotransferase class I/II-fold pyridoxal phosphate-dependent enzyme [Actinocrinis sp.]